MYLPFWGVVFVCVEEDVCENGVCSVYGWWRLNARESSLGVCSEMCPVCFPIVCECVSGLLKFVFGACVDCCDYGKVV